MKELNQKLQDMADLADFDPSSAPEALLKGLLDTALSALTEIANKSGSLRWDLHDVHVELYKALDTRTPEEKLEERIRAAVRGSVCNAMNYPTDIGAKILGRDMSAVVEKTSGAVLEVLFAESVRKTQEKTQYRAVWASGSAMSPDTEEGARKQVKAWEAGWVEYKAPGGDWCKL